LGILNIIIYNFGILVTTEESMISDRTKIFVLVTVSTLALALTQPQARQTEGTFPWDVKLTVVPHLVPVLKICGDMPPLSHLSSLTFTQGSSISEVCHWTLF
jgi:hypothetical protein